MGRTFAGFVAAVSVLLAACGDDGDGASEEESRPGEDAAPEVVAFCDQVDTFYREVDGLYAEEPPTAGADEETRQRVLGALDEVTPPDDVAEDWAVLEDGYVRFIDAWTETDWEGLESQMGALDGQGDEEAAEDLLGEAMAPFEVLQEEETLAAQTRVDGYIAENCGEG